ncbi:hypothetical protein V7079_28135 [Priestia megaterium]|uniref:hypothetical protein n=1 Tax=Priestia megaterium TaxID=1404 RepID=UPI001145C4C1|nr:hypothetical protein [Priestia megaterium]
MQKLIHYYSEHRISFFFRKSFQWMFFYILSLLICGVYCMTYSLFLERNIITSYLIPTAFILIGIGCYAYLMYLLEKSLGNLENVPLKVKICRCRAAIFNTRGMLRVTELPSVKEEQIRKLKKEFLDKEQIDSKEKVYTLIEELERKFEYENKHRFFIPLSFSWFLALFIPIWTLSIKLGKDVLKPDFPSITFGDITSMVIILVFIFLAFYVIISFFKTTFRNLVMFHFPSTRHKIEILVGLLQEIYLWYCFNEEEGKDKNK